MTTEQEIRIVEADAPADVDGMVATHLEAFPHHFMSQMGDRFLRLYYGRLLSYAGHIAIIAKTGAQVAGFATGFHDPAAFYAHLRSQPWRSGWIVACRALARPSLIPRIARNTRRVAQIAGSNNDVELSSVGVRPELSGKGIGSRLIAQFIASAFRLGSSSVYLTTDAIENEAAIRLYQKHGFAVETPLARGTRQMNLYRLRF